jgi:hypothetical protein
MDGFETRAAIDGDLRQERLSSGIRSRDGTPEQRQPTTSHLSQGLQVVEDAIVARESATWDA